MAATLALELASVAGAVLLLGGAGGATRFAAAACGAALITAFSLPSLGALLWGRGRSHTAFMATLGGVILAKLVYVGAAVYVVWARTELPRLEFLLGLMGGWLAAFAVQAVVLRRTLAGHGAVP